MHRSRARIRAFLICGVAATALLGLLVLAVATHRNRSFEAAVEAAGGRVLWEFQGPEWVKDMVPKAILDRFSKVAWTTLYRDPSHPPFTDAHWQRLLPIYKSSPFVHGVSFENTHITDATVETLQDLPQLEILSLQGTRITDRSLKTISGLKTLKCLDLGGTRVSDAGLKRLRSLTELQLLILDHTTISEAGLEPLKGLSKLDHLSVVNTGLTEEALQSLQEKLPDLMISDD